jgi:tetratricopeptide (TPR) repeat protein
MIVVGIDSPDRWRDLTPVEGMGIPGTGGGDLFVESLAGEILPHIDATYRTNGFRVFSGHSLGGLTTIYTLFEKPEIFDAYLALSPSLEWDEGFMLDRARRFLARHEIPDAMLYLALADERLERQFYDLMVQLLEESAPPQLIWTSQLFEEQDDHMSTRVTAGLAGVRWVFRDWRLGSNRIYAMSPDEIEAHYAMATARYKEPRELGMMEITDAGYWGLYDEATVDRAMEFFELAVEKWPDEAYTYSCLGEGLERTGRLEEALVQMERALRMAKESDTRDIAYFQGMVDRVTAALDD